MLPRNPQIYTMFCSILISLFIYPVKLKFNIYSKLILSLILFILIGSVIRFFTSFQVNFRDYSEAIRYLPISLIFLSMERWKKIKLEKLIDAIFVYVLIDGFVSYLQVTNLDLLGIKNIVRVVYNANHHYQRSLELSNRSLGLSGGPGDHAAIVFVVFMIMMAELFLSKERKIICSIGAVISFLVIVSSQSRTVFVAMLVSIFISLLLFFVKKTLANILVIRSIWTIILLYF